MVPCRNTCPCPETFCLLVPQLNWEEMAMVEPLSVAAHAVKRAGIQTGDDTAYWSWVVAPSDWPLWYLPTCPGSQGHRPLDTNRMPSIGKRLIFLPGQPLMQSRWGIRPGRKKPSFFRSAFQVGLLMLRGNKQAMESRALFWAGHGGSFILVGLYKGSVCVVHHPSIHAKELSLLCSRNATKSDFLEVIKVLSQKKIPYRKVPYP